MQALLGFAFVLTLFSTAIIGSVGLMGPTMLFLLFQRGLYRRWNGVGVGPGSGHMFGADSARPQVVAKMWFLLVCILLEKIFGVEMIFYGERVG